MKVQSETLPPLVSVRRDLGQNIFTVAFDIEHTAEGYEYETAELPPGVWRRDLIISAIVRAKYSADDMEAIMNNVLGDISSKKARDEHRAMQQWRMKAKQWATELMQWAQDNGMAEAETLPDPTPAEPDETIEGGDGIDTLSAVTRWASS